ncbi:MAG: MarR family transcriptional regulator [Dehalococcoidia bacterium]
MNDMKMYDMEFTDPTMTTWTLLRQTWTAVNKVAETRLGKLRLTPEKAAVLWACKDYPGTLTPAEIARLMFREAQTIAGLLNRMEREGLVKRIPKRKGRPFTEIRLTEKGKGICDAGIEVYKHLIQGLTSDLSAKEREELHGSLRKLRQKMLDEEHIEPRHVPGYPQGKQIPIEW